MQLSSCKGNGKLVLLVKFEGRVFWGLVEKLFESVLTGPVVSNIHKLQPEFCVWV